MCIAGGPSAPPPVQTPTPVQESRPARHDGGTAARERDQRRRAAATGPAQTVLTGGGLSGSEGRTTKTLLGQ